MNKAQSQSRAQRRQHLLNIRRLELKAISPEEKKMYSEYGRLVGRYYKTGQIPTDDEMRAAGFQTQEEFNEANLPPVNENIPSIEQR